MTRSTTSLHRHLLTRSDLAHLQVPAGDVLTWLAEGAIEQVGELATPDDPVFMVPSAELRRQLAPRLAEIGKPTVVLTPLRVRSFLMRTLLAHGAPDNKTAATDSTATPSTVDDVALVAALQSAAAEIEADVEVMLRLAAEEAQLELLAAVESTTPATELAVADARPDSDATESAPGLDTEPEVESSPAPEETPEANPDEAPEAEEECFEFDDLTSALDELLPDPPAAALPPSADIETPETEELPAESEPAPTEPSPTETTMPVEAATTHESDPLDEVLAVADGTESARLPTGAEVAAVLDLFESGTAPTSTETAGATQTTPETTTDGQPEPEVDTTVAPDAMATEPTPDPTPEPAPIASATAEVASPAPAATPTLNAPTNVANQALERVESFLAQLKDTLVELAQRPAPAPVVPLPPSPAPNLDVAPLVQVVQQGFERSSQQAEAAQKAITSLGEHVAALGPGLQAIAARPVPAPTIVQSPASAPQERPVAEFIVTRTSRAPVVMLTLAAMVVAWSMLFWVKTGSMKLALGTLIGGNLVACSLLAFGRQR